MNKFFTAVLCLLVSSVSFAQLKKYDFKFTIKGLTDTVIMAKYYGNRLAYKDTVASVNGVLHYQNERDLEGGMYALVIPESDSTKTYYDFVVNNEEKIVIEADINNLNQSTKVIKSEENKYLFDYIQFISSMRQKADPINAKIASTKDEKEKEALEAELKAIGDEVTAKQNEIKASSLLAGKLISMSYDIFVPQAPEGQPDTWRYQYYKTHFFDNFDFNDDRIVNSVIFHNKLEQYFTKVIAQAPDSIIAAADKLLARCPDGSETFKYITHFITYKYETSKIICMDAVFVHMALTYYANGKAFWLDQDKVEKIVERAKELKPITCGLKAPRLQLVDTSGNWKDLYAVDAEYTVLVFWEHNCGHCKKELPKLVEVIKKFDPAFVKVFAVETDLEMEGMKEYMKKNDISVFINVSDTKEINENAHQYIREGKTTVESLNFRTTYDIFATPKVFLLDIDKVIKAKQLGAEQLEQLLNYFKDEDSKK